jgi:hypothetical protein
VLLFARATDDDVIAVHSTGLDPVRELTHRYLADFARIRALGGLYLLSYHSQLLARPELVPVLAKLAREVAADPNVWRATAGDVAVWWRAKANLRVDSRRDTSGNVSVSVRNSGPSSVNGATLRVMLGPDERVRSSLRQLQSSPGVARLVLPEIKSGETQTVWLSVTAGRARPR